MATRRNTEPATPGMFSIVPCSACDDKREELRSLGFRVRACKPMAERPGFCRVDFEPGPARRDSTSDTAPPARARRLTATQVATAQAIVNLFETGHVLGDYGAVTLIEGDTGHLTFGRSQTTLGSGNLARLLAQYCANAGAVFGERLAPWLPRFAAVDLTLDHDAKLHNLLRATADDRVMRDTQDGFFDQAYWQPAQRAALQLGITGPLGTAVVYDSVVHGSWPRLRDRTTAAVGTPAAVGERRWIAEYVRQRRRWLGTHPRADLRATVYRMDAFQRLIDNDQWALALPLVVRGQEISAPALSALPPGCWDGPLPGSRAIGLATPLLRGLDVRRVQLALSDRNVPIRADAIYGPASVRLVKAFQAAQGQPATGTLDPAAIVALVG